MIPKLTPHKMVEHSMTFQTHSRSLSNIDSPQRYSTLNLPNMTCAGLTTLKTELVIEAIWVIGGSILGRGSTGHHLDTFSCVSTF